MILVADTETTGLDDDSEIAQFAMQMYDGERRIVGEFKTMVLPDGWIMPQELTDKFGIDQARLEKYGLKAKTVMAMFDAWCQRCDVLVFHNAKYDLGRIRYTVRRLGLTVGMPQKIHCTQALATPVVKMPPTEKMIAKGMTGHFKPPKLIEAYQHAFGETFDGAHDAMADVRAAARLYFWLKDQGAIEE